MAGRAPDPVTGTDARGYAVGGEDADYGDLLGNLSGLLHTIHERIRAQ